MGWSILNDKLKTVADTSHTAERVLIVEDDPATRSGLTELVRAWGFTAEEAADGAEALEKVTAFRPSIVVTDLVMPRMSGRELTEQIHLRLPGVPILCTSGFERRTTDEDEAYLAKPFTSQELLRHVKRMLLTAAGE